MHRGISGQIGQAVISHATMALLFEKDIARKLCMEVRSVAMVTVSIDMRILKLDHVMISIVLVRFNFFNNFDICTCHYQVNCNFAIQTLSFMKLF